MKVMREVIKTNCEEESTIVCCNDIFSEHISNFRPILQYGGILFTDSNVEALYHDEIAKYFAGVPVFVMQAGEENKNEETLFALLRAMAEHGLRRNSTLLALGGGVVGDIGGLAASLYMRGIYYIQVPTTLLAQVDSSVGGKTAIDFCGVKNLIGAFKQPILVYADPSFFATLPPREIRCGLGEIIKHGALHRPLFDLLWKNRDRLFDLDFLAEIVPQNIAFKADIVRKDPHEKELRKCLNLGHTTAHTIELSGAGLSHGECVLLGLLYEVHLADMVYSVSSDFMEKLTVLIESVLDCDIRAIDIAAGARLALMDKKNEKKESVTCTLPVGVGDYRIREFPLEEYREKLIQIRETL